MTNEPNSSKALSQAELKKAVNNIEEAFKENRKLGLKKVPTQALLYREGILFCTLSHAIRTQKLHLLPESILTPELMLQKVEEEWDNSFHLAYSEGNQKILDFPPSVFTKKTLQSKIRMSSQKISVFNHILSVAKKELPFNPEILIKNPEIVQEVNVDKENSLHFAIQGSTLHLIPKELLTPENLLVRNHKEISPLDLTAVKPGPYSRQNFQLIPISTLVKILTKHKGDEQAQKSLKKGFINYPEIKTKVLRFRRAQIQIKMSKESNLLKAS